MTIFAIGDLHMSGDGAKPMDVFGPQWDRHMDAVRERWFQTVRPTDTVLIPGDISWAMQFEDAKRDLLILAAFPGTKVLLRGNHDFWWSSITQLRAFLPPGMLALQNDSVAIGGVAVCGTRGWDFPTEMLPLDEQGTKIYRRELIRLRMALESARGRNLPILAMTHYPPLLQDYRDTAFTSLMEEYDVRRCVYGHLHGAGIRNGYSGVHRGVEYRLTSCDAIDFTPVAVWETEQ
jgi:uncharacterized protein